MTAIAWAGIVGVNVAAALARATAPLTSVGRRPGQPARVRLRWPTPSSPYG